MADQSSIKGHRELSPDEVALINEIKEHGERFGELCERVGAAGVTVDFRWISIGTTHLQQGVMALVRAVAKPTTF